MRLIKWLAISVPCLYVGYIVVGMSLLSLGMVNEWVVFPNKVIANDRDQEADDDDSKADTDGPYIFHYDSLVIRKQIIPAGNGLKVLIDTFASHQKSGIQIACMLTAHPDWNFTTRLKDTLVPEPTAYPNADKLLAISDIEGNFEAFKALLQTSGVINEKYDWTFGSGHLVLVGDFFDRGLNVTEVLWLIYHLEQAAETAGGRVHFILGNHELMVLGEDLRYVKDKYFENANLIKEPYNNLFKANTELGRWLQTKNVAEKIGNILFVHGGFSDEINSLTLDLAGINHQSRPYFLQTDSARQAMLKGRDIKLLFHHALSPSWYRGYVKDEASTEQVNNTLRKFQAFHIVVGHTLVDEIRTFYDGKVIAIDVPHAKGTSQALLYQDHKFFMLDNWGKRKEL